MSDEQSVTLSGIAALRTRLVTVAVAVSLPAVLLMAYYLSVLLGLSSAEMRSIGIAASIVSVAVGGGCVGLLRRFDQPIGRYLEARAAGGNGDVEARPAFRAVMALPRRIQQLYLFSWCVGAVLIGAAMWGAGFEGWALGQRFAALVAVGCSCGVVSATVFFFVAKRELGALRAALTVCIEDPKERGAMITPLSLSRKIQGVVVGSVISSLGLVVAVAFTHVRDSEDARAATWQVQSLAAVAPLAEHMPLETALEAVLPATELAPYETRFFEMAAAIEMREGSKTSADSLDFVESRVREGQSQGLRSDVNASELLAWHSLADGRVMVAALDRELVPRMFSALWTAMAPVLILAIGLCFGVALLLTGDLKRSTGALTRESARMESGDLRRAVIFESEDELGDLSRAFEIMGSSLRATVSRVVGAADRVEGAASEIAGVAVSVSAASADQVARIQRASQLMLEIKGQVTSVAGSAHALNESVEESSSSILELGAAGDELNDTASALSERVDEVSSSIEQMVRSVKQVGSNSEVLTDAAIDTSSSMEEMASAMRVVDTTAELTAELSRDVVVTAEKGQAKVSETIDGMGMIRDSSDVLERVIQGLAARATEVGAILDVIDDVADETNLLALNAAIIAAQAGEHGRAFSVVAEEIKELADRVLASTKEIGGLIRSVQEESSNAADAIEESSRSVATGVERSAEAGTSLEEITRASRESGTRIGEILSAVREQTKAASHVVELMDRVRGGVEEITAAGAEQDRGNEVVFRSSLAMREVAQQVRRTTDEQARGFGRIRENVEGVRDAAEQITGSLQEQSSACGQVAEFLEQVYERTRSNEQAAQQMGESTADLVRQAQALREDVAKFQT